MHIVLVWTTFVWYFSGTDKLWPGVFIFTAFPAVVCLVCLPFCPESPRYLLITRGKEVDARKGRYVLYTLW